MGSGDSLGAPCFGCTMFCPAVASRCTLRTAVLLIGVRIQRFHIRTHIHYLIIIITIKAHTTHTLVLAQVDVARSKNVPLIRKLVKMKGMPNNHCHSKDGANALVECCKNGSIEGFKAILMAGANIDSPNKKGVRMCVRGWVVPPSSQAVGSCVIPLRPYSLPARALCSSAQSRTFN